MHRPGHNIATHAIGGSSPGSLAFQSGFVGHSSTTFRNVTNTKKLHWLGLRSTSHSELLEM